MDSKIVGVPLVLLFLIGAIVLPILTVIVLLNAVQADQLTAIRNEQNNIRTYVLEGLKTTPVPTATPSAAPSPVKKVVPVTKPSTTVIPVK